MSIMYEQGSRFGDSFHSSNSLLSGATILFHGFMPSGARIRTIQEGGQVGG